MQTAGRIRIVKNVHIHYIPARREEDGTGGLFDGLIRGKNRKKD